MRKGIRSWIGANTDMGLLDQILLKPKIGAGIPNSGRTPPMFGGKPGLVQDPSGKTIDIPNDPNSPLSAADKAEIDTIAHPPQRGVNYETGAKIGKLRSVLGTIAETAGPFIGKGNLAILGNKLLYPGADKYQGDVQRTSQIANIQDRAAQRAQVTENQRMMRDQAAANEADRQQGSIDNILKAGGTVAPLAPAGLPTLNKTLVQPPPMQKTAIPPMLQPQQPPNAQDLADLPRQQADLMPTIGKTEDAIDPISGKRVSDIGTVQSLAVPGQKGQKRDYVIPNANEMERRKASQRAAELEAAKTETVTPELAAQFKELGGAEDYTGRKVTQAEKRELVSFVQARLNSRDTIDAKPEKASKENENEWIAISSDPKSTPEAKANADAKLKRLHDERLATRPVNENATQSQLDRLITRNAKPHEKAIADADSHLEKIDDARNMINGPAAAQALGIPKVLTALVSGQGSGVRITQAELNSIGQARGITGDVQGWINKMSGQGTLTKEQQAQLSQVLDDVRAKVLQKRAIAKEALDNINGAESRDEVIRHVKVAGDKMAALATGSAATAAVVAPIEQHSESTGQYRHSLDGGKTWLPGRK